MDFYTREQAATILGVTKYTISNYVKKGILKNYGKGRSLLLSFAEVNNFYENNIEKNAKITRADVLVLENKITSMEQDLNVLKIALGLGANSRPRTDEELCTLNTELMRFLSFTSWSNKEIFRVADLCISLRDGEIERWITLKGVRGWNALLDLSERMLKFIECMPVQQSVRDILTCRLEAGRNRMYGLIFVSLQNTIGIDKYWAKSLKPKNKASIDDYIAMYLRNRP